MRSQPRTPVSPNLLGTAVAPQPVLIPEPLHALATDTKALANLPSARAVRPRGDDPQPQILTQWSHDGFLIRSTILEQSLCVYLIRICSNAEQQRVFAPTPRRKVVVATNIAETSLTIPGIRFVIDTGLARISRYVPQSRTRRLPVEPVAQSSADQRKGRCGRVSDGVCIRLYAEQDFNDRPRFAQPEIQRSNLADVILRMKAFSLGDIEEFPFLNAPPAKGIRAGYALLEELGALVGVGANSPDESRRVGAVAPNGPSNGAKAVEGNRPYHEYVLTGLGRELAHLPVDPTVGRMILQARNEKALREVLVIAAALSIQDPRERPLDQQQKADAAHRRFTNPESDFLTLLAIWEAYHGEFEQMTLGKLRRFCTTHFLSFMRMREWRDVHAQLVDTIEGREGFVATSVYDGLKPGKEIPLTLDTPAYRAIHRSILAGLLGNIATRADDGTYHATHDRKVAMFPGSALFERQERRKTAAPRKEGPAKPKTARWLMAAEIMETGKIYARNCARIDPHWTLDLAGHLIKASHSEPFWNPEAGRVLVKERRRLYNLELETRSVGYGRINPAHATEIFIREGLVGDTITWPFDFLRHNRRLKETVENLLTRTRSAGYMDLDEARYRFYAARLENVSSVPELVDCVRHRQTTEPKFLSMTDDDIKPPAELAHEAGAFPEQLFLDNRALPLNYAYRPGKEDDGVTLRVNLDEALALTPAALDWAVPGHLQEKIELMLKSLPKEQRRTLIPLTETAQKIAADIGLITHRSSRPLLAQALAEMLTERLGVRLDPKYWAGRPLPDHLRVRVEVLDRKGKVLCASRDLTELFALLQDQGRAASREVAARESTAWRAARAKWETEPAAEWKFGDLPESIVVEDTGTPVVAHVGLRAESAGAAVRLFAAPEDARAATREGLRALFEAHLKHELGWLGRDLPELRPLGPLAVTLIPRNTLQEHVLECITRWACGREVRPLHTVVFARELAAAKAGLHGAVTALAGWLREIFALRLALQTHPEPYPGLAEDLAVLVPTEFLRTTPYERLQHLPRYLKTRLARADRWKRDPVKDAARARELIPFAAAVRRLGSRAREYRWLVEEFRVSLFAQELGTMEPVSIVRLQRALDELEKTDFGAMAAGSPAPVVRLALPLPVKGKTVLRSFGALGRLRP